MAKVHIIDPHGNQDGLAGSSPNLTPIHQLSAEHHMASATSIVHTVEAM